MKIQPPSKNFIKKAGIATLLVIIFIGAQIYSKRKPASEIKNNATVANIVGSDSNKNGIMDWEERLWGLDPNVAITNGVSNKEIIEGKKASLGIDTNDKNLTETDKTAREIFAVTAALSQNDGFDLDALNELSKKIGEGANIEIGEPFSIEKIKTVTTTKKSLETYYNQLISIIKKYEKNASETEILVTAVEEDLTSELGNLSSNATIYKSMIEELSLISVPVGVAREHVGILNSFRNIQTGLELIAKTEKDALKGAGGASLYRAGLITLEVYNNSLRDYLTRYSII